jgi:predicted metal-binding membrane protein
MDRLQKTLLVSLVSISAVAWAASQAVQAGIMSVMMAPYDALSVSLFVAVWTVGMAAMMFPAISPIVLLYNRLAKNGDSNTALVEVGKGPYSIKMVLFVGCYLAVWALAGLVLLLSWSLLLNSAVAVTGLTSAIYGSILIAAGAYQFSPIKAKCLAYCESPMSFFMRRWRNGTAGAVTMGTYHGLYCLGCCWPYFLLMVALGWMDVLWMALFAGIIFGEKMWSRGILVSRAAGVGLAIVGAITMLGVVDISSSHDAMENQEMPAMDTQGPSPVQEQMTGMQEPSEDQTSDNSVSGMDM